jgi:preprotein translocase subunit Sss1
VKLLELVLLITALVFLVIAIVGFFVFVLPEALT